MPKPNFRDDDDLGESITTDIDLNGDSSANSGGQNGEPVKARENSSSKEDDEIEVVVIDDTPAGDRGRERRKPGTESAVPGDDEIGKYTQGVQDRIKKMRWEYHEERREKEQWQREHAAAIDMAKRLHAENTKMRELVQKGHKTLLDTNKSALTGEIDALKQSLMAAMDAGDSAKVADLQGKIAMASARTVALDQQQPIAFEREPQQAPQQQQQIAPQLSKPMRSWLNDNPWFNDDRKMTAYAYGVHDELVRDGIKPETPAYFRAVNEEMRKTFPKYFKDNGEEIEPNDRTNNDSGRSPAQRRTVGAPTRGGNNGAPEQRRGKLTLTQSEAAVARRMGVSPQQYAQEKLRLMEQDNG